MRSMSMRDLESTPGQLYWRRWEPEMMRTRKGRLSSASLPFSSLGRIALGPGGTHVVLRLAAFGLENPLSRGRMPGELFCRTTRPSQQFATAIRTDTLQHILRAV